jgi:transcriptional regulator with XRE-family HTH domain
MPRKLVHYLRNERRRAALTQADIAALLGGTWKGRVSWYERGAMPPTEKALEYEAILGKPVSELLGGAYERAAFNVRRRARGLLEREGVVPNTPQRLRRRRTLERIAA